MSDQEMRRRVPQGALWSAIEVWGVELLQFAVFAMLARLLGPSVYGLVGLAMMPVLFANVFLAKGGWMEYVIQRPELDDLSVDSIFWAVVGIGVLLGAIVILIAPLLATAFDDPRFGSIVPALAACPPLMALSVVPSALLQREINLAPLALRSTLAVTVAGAVGIGMAAAGYGAWSLVAFEILLPSVSALVLWRAVKWQPSLRWSAARIGEAAHYAFRISGERFINLTETLIPRATLGTTQGADAVGHWTLARKIFDLSAELVQRPALRVALPRFAAARDNPHQLTEMLGTATELTAMIAVPGYVVLAVMAPDLAALAFGDAWRPAGEALAVLAMLGLITPLTQLSMSVLYATGHVAWTFSLSIGGFVLLLALLPQALSHGVTGIAIAFLARGWIVLVARLWIIRRIAGVRLRGLGRVIVPPVFAGAAMAIVLLSSRMLLAGAVGEVPLTALALLLGLAGYVLVLLLVAKDRVLQAVAFGRRAFDSGRGAGTDP